MTSPDTNDHAAAGINLPATISSEIIRPATMPAATFAVQATLAEEAGLNSWWKHHGNFRNHRIGVDGYGTDSVDNAIEDAFKRPFPPAVVEEWRQTAGYVYGDDMPRIQRVVWVEPPADLNTEQIVAVNRGMSQFEASRLSADTGVRIGLGTPHKDDAEKVAVLPLTVRRARSASSSDNDPRNTQLIIGSEVGLHEFHKLTVRASQELAVVANRFLALSGVEHSTKLPERLPYHSPPELKANNTTEPGPAKKTFWQRLNGE